MRHPVILLFCLMLAGCYLDPYRNPGDWAMTGASGKNLAVQVAYPSDLITGRSGGYANGVAAAAGVDRALGGAASTGAGLLTPPANNMPSLSIGGS